VAAACAPWGRPVAEALLLPLAGGTLTLLPVLVPVGEAEGVCDGEADGDAVVGGGLVGEAGAVGDCVTGLGVADGVLLDGGADGVGVAEGDDDGRGVGHRDAGDWP
jgi:hypothetical protein